MRQSIRILTDGDDKQLQEMQEFRSSKKERSNH